MTRIAKLGEGVLLLLTHASLLNQCCVDSEAAAEGCVPRGGQSMGWGGGEGARSQRAHGQRSRVT
jgi:hypothetical protein